MRTARKPVADSRSSGPGHDPAELLDVRAVADLLGCSTRHVLRLSDSGRMPPPYKLGQLIRWNRRRLLEWIDESCPQVSEPGRANR